MIELSWIRRMSWMALSAAPLVAQQAGAGDTFRSELRPILSRYCFKCHGARKPKGGIDLASATSAADVVRDYQLWRRVMAVVDGEAMPPESQRLRC